VVAQPRAGEAGPRGKVGRSKRSAA